MAYCTEQELIDMMSQLELKTTIAKTETFTATPGELPLAFIAKCLTYGFQRYFNDGVGGSDKDAKTKCDLVRAELAEIKRGIWSPGRTQSSADEETTLQRRAVRALLSTEDKKAIKALADPEAKLDETWAKIAALADDNPAKMALEHEFAELKRQAQAKAIRPAKGTISLGG